MATLKAPFNFVPLNNQIYSTNEWANKISQDIPFSDGLSGVLTLKVIAKSPVFIKNGDNQTAEAADDVREFSHTDDGRYFIPATSLKGVIRSVLEIISFGKLTQYQNLSFGIRDLTRSVDGDFYRAIIKPANIHCGWLRKDGSGYKIKDCGIPYRISAETIQTKFGNGFMDFISGNMPGMSLRDDVNRTAKAKYTLLGGCNLKSTFSLDEKLNYEKSQVDERKFVRFGNQIKGTIVLTGQSSARKFKDGKWSGKFYEFVFPDVVEAEKTLDREIFRRFETVHQNSPDYKDYFRSKLYRGEEIPVFFVYDNNREIEGLGLAYMFKYPARFAISDGIPESLKNEDDHDLAECMFGFTSEEAEMSLKGRVMFSHAFLEGKPEFAETVKMALSTPHPSYYPLYLGKGQTWNSSTSIQLAGRKRYPVRKKPYKNDGTDAMSFYIRPLREESKFIGTVRFHNLRPIELGALLNAINLWNDENTYYHTIGQSKPLGYGKVTMNATVECLTSNSEEYNQDSNFVELFQKEMRQNFVDWDNCPQIIELKRMALGIPEGREEEFKYMKMSTSPKDNEFKIGKDEYSKGKQLGLFSQIIDHKVPIAPPVQSMDIKAWEKLKKAEERRKAEAEQQQRKNEELIRTILTLAEENKLSSVKKLIEENKELENKQEIEEIKARIELAQKETENLTKDAETFIANEQFEKAKEKYEEANKLGLIDFENEIKLCQFNIEQSESKTGDLSPFLASIQSLNSPPAFANKLKGRYDDFEKVKDELEEIAEFIRLKLEGENKKTKQQWQTSRNWDKFINVIGEENTRILFKLVNGKDL